MELDGFLALLTSFYFQMVIFIPLVTYLTVGCGVCDNSSSSSAEHNNSDEGLGDVMSTKSRDSSGFDINPAISPVYEQHGTESASDWNIFGESIGQLGWWNAKILGSCGGGGSSTI